jgi:predicted methyltransferase
MIVSLRICLGMAAATLMLSVYANRAFAEPPPSYIAAALADPDRPAEARAEDADRKPGELLRLIGIKPGDKIMDVIPGKYWDRMFSDVVGKTGHVYLFIPPEYNLAGHQPLPTSPFWIVGHSNITWAVAPMSSFSAPEPLDIVWIRDNYHDLYDPVMGPTDIPAFNKAVYRALKPQGLYVIIDHAAHDGAGISQTNTLHRIDPAVVKKDMAAAGFVFVGESDALRLPTDLKDKVITDPSLLGRTDQFVYLFRKR